MIIGETQLTTKIKEIRVYDKDQYYDINTVVMYRGYIYRAKDVIIGINPEDELLYSGATKWERLSHPSELYTMFFGLGTDLNLPDADKTIHIKYDMAQSKLYLMDKDLNIVSQPSTGNVRFRLGDYISGWYFNVQGVKVPNWDVDVISISGSPDEGNFMVTFKIKLKNILNTDRISAGSFVEALCNLY